jgi:hypothetical protein
MPLGMGTMKTRYRYISVSSSHWKQCTDEAVMSTTTASRKRDARSVASWRLRRANHELARIETNIVCRLGAEWCRYGRDVVLHSQSDSNTGRDRRSGIALHRRSDALFQSHHLLHSRRSRRLGLIIRARKSVCFPVPTVHETWGGRS